MFRIKDVVNIIKEFAPLELQADYDNCGLLYGDEEWTYNGTLITLDLSTDVVEEAINNGANLIIEHHPSLFYPIKKIDLSIPKHRAIALAIKNDIAIYSAHTCVDFTNGGLNDKVMELLKCESFYRANGEASDMRIGVLQKSIKLCELVELVKNIFKDEHVSYVGDKDKLIDKIAVINGGGGCETEIYNAIKYGAQVFISADFKYNAIRLAKDLNYAIIIFGHYNSELPFINLIKDKLIDKGIESVYCATTCTNPLN